MIKRHLETVGFDPGLGRQMRFVSGPRQAGKTTLARRVLADCGTDGLYYNWDLREIRDAYRRDPRFFENRLRGESPKKGLPWICFDEIHKMPRWKNILKGTFDAFESQASFIVTGSARLDWFRRSGDSLAGRYFLFRLNPVSLSELAGRPYFFPEADEGASGLFERKISAARPKPDLLDQLLRFSGFPEPLTKADSAFHLRWQRDMVDDVTRGDVRDLTRIPDVEFVASIMQILPERVGAPLSLNALREDIETSHTAVRNAIRALELTCAIFLVSPYSRKIARAVKKERKAYFFDWTRCADPAKRFENYCAVELKTMINLWHDAGLGDFDLRYVRTRDGLESDFLITRNGVPWALLEAKLQDETAGRHHREQARALGDIPFIQIVAKHGVFRKSGLGVTIVSASRLFAG